MPGTANQSSRVHIVEEVEDSDSGHELTTQDTPFLSEANDDIPPPKSDIGAPPPYDTVDALPTYEEVQREKATAGEHSRPPPHERTQHHALVDLDLDNLENRDRLLGTDFMFFSAFFVAFLFNWIGFLLLLCFCHTIAGRYGALAGFGLSLAKWTLIVKHSTELIDHDSSWVWWLITGFGVLVCVRAILQYIHIKREWAMIARAAQERYLFFY